MYYPDETIEEVIRSNDIVDIISPYVRLKKNGSNYFGLCPFHNEKSPSFSVSRDKQMFYCFGCGQGGNSLTFLMKHENASFQEALQMLADRAGITLPEVNLSEEARKVSLHRNRLLDINRETATYYFRALRSPAGTTGMKYLNGRGLSKETLHRFGLGYASGSRDDLIRYLRKKEFTDEEILEAGVAAFDEKNGMHDKFWNRVIFPIQDVTGKVIGFGGRVMGDGKPKYLNSPETPVFDKSRNLYGLNHARRTRKGYMILCEGYMDVIAMHQAGFEEAVASLGTSFTQGQAALLKKYVQEVILSYDSDQAGITAALRNMQILKHAGIRCKVLDLKPYKDPDEFMKAEGKENFQKRLESAENAFLYRCRMAERNYKMHDPAERTAFYRQIARFLCEFEDDMERENYIKAVAEKYYIKEAQMNTLVQSYQKAGGAQLESSPVRTFQGTAWNNKGQSTVDTAKRKNQGLLLTWLADYPELYRQVGKYISPEDFEEGVYRIAADKFLRLLQQNDSLAEVMDISSVIAQFDDPEEQNLAAQIFNTRLDNLTENTDTERAFEDVICAVKRESVHAAALHSGQDAAQLMKLIGAKKELEELSRIRVHIKE